MIVLRIERKVTQIELLNNRAVLGIESFIAGRIIKTDARKDVSQKRATKPIIQIAVGGIAVGVAVMVLSISILTGFQKEIREKVVGFGSHIQVTSFDNSNRTVAVHPVSKNQDFYPHIDSLKEVQSIHVFAQKPGILKADDEISGVVFKGVGADFNADFFQRNMQEGRVPAYTDTARSDSIIISRHIADKMRLGVNDKLLIYFVQNNKPRPRRFFVAGIYQTGLEGFDNLVVPGDIKHVQSINGWDEDRVGGFEINLSDYKYLESMDRLIYENIPYEMKSETIIEKHPDIFGWLELQDMNVIVILILIILVSGINMTSALLVMILERTRMIGILKTMGAQNLSIRKLFLYVAAYLIAKGLLWGNAVGIGLVLIQKHFKLAKLPEESYYLSYVPVNLNWTDLLFLNIGTLVLCTAILIIPSYVVTRISPVKAIRFD